MLSLHRSRRIERQQLLEEREQLLEELRASDSVALRRRVVDGGWLRRRRGGRRRRLGLRLGHRRRFVLRKAYRRRLIGDRRNGMAVAVIRQVRDNHRRVDSYVMVMVHNAVEERVAKESRSALGRRAVDLAAERNERLLGAVVATGWRRDDLGRLLPGARRTRRAVELREAFGLELPVLANDVSRQRDAEGAGLAHLSHGRALVLALAVPALHGHLKTWGK